MDNKIIIAIIVSVGIIGYAGVSSYTKFELNKKEFNQKIQLEDRKAKDEKANRERISNCLQNAYSVYIEDWNDNCKMNGLGDDCALPAYNLKVHDDRLKVAQDRCYK